VVVKYILSVYMLLVITHVSWNHCPLFWRWDLLIQINSLHSSERPWCLSQVIPCRWDCIILQRMLKCCPRGYQCCPRQGNAACTMLGDFTLCLGHCSLPWLLPICTHLSVLLPTRLTPGSQHIQCSSWVLLLLATEPSGCWNILQRLIRRGTLQWHWDDK
jgi:hypothetical protein